MTDQDTDSGPVTSGWAPAGVDLSVPNVARMYDFYLGGKDNFAPDRVAAERALAAYPDLLSVTRASRAFLGRAVQFLVIEAGISQLLDIGSGLPTRQNVHFVAQKADPKARTVYVDYDPIVCAHARALLSDDQTGVVQADLREPERILQDPVTRQLLDFDRPVGVIMAAVLHFIPDEQRPYDLVRRIMEPLAPGSHLVIGHAGGDELPDAARRAATQYSDASAQMTFRTGDQIRRFFDKMDLVEPGLVGVGDWRNPVPLRPEVRKKLVRAGLVAVGSKPN